MIQIHDRRNAVRIGWNIPVELLKRELKLSFEGITENVSQRGAFVKTEHWQCFNVDDHAKIICLLPPDCTGQCEIICIQGEGTVCRVDPIKQGVALKFRQNFKQFARSRHTAQGQRIAEFGLRPPARRGLRPGGIADLKNQE